ncbi:uncharacterized protein FFUJ_12150 [Fusarium fujikuroi IMI 58289]|uniref:F-box domain-containing protein n=1 Tax=Gibberella fujikuroi (strain CBS 195.34 / IMI 58289 / NRRL A-6831) TaxID=1279085 RepID=S0EIT9_GIBF5|nr:uncharacterized protein FFUJ_12150 [Fusarium fujikuroi IMI 58289]KLO90414.1 uncharacterized protein LW93_5878 [Fusarium fujikuroi]KLO95596.1 uncharacterized protein Y057_353 [Fusarium fujikuroi]KLP14754.1 uncharacterized protein LW94_10471 [Fusarium fujikuroi]CCT72298.1 uncharacterized protein FFUJ_12150 [Fusarium fujikuroi IMI 58289]SCO11725.1 uncharacterized protein FFC1_11573 [Fusarium fujikuroi]
MLINNTYCIIRPAHSLSHAGSAQKKAWIIGTQDLFLYNSIQSPLNSVAVENISGSALLSKLPPEVVTMIFDQAPQVDKIMLAMTCKSLLATSRLCGLSVPLRESHMATWNGPDSSTSVSAKGRPWSTK